MTDQLEKATWLYKPVDNIPNLNKIQKECYRIYSTFFKDACNEVGWTITGVNIELMTKLAPNYINFLKKLGLYEIYSGAAFSASIGVQKQSCPVHVDCEDWRQLPYSLNIPVIGCEDSYTVFYDVDESNSSKNGLPENWDNNYLKMNKIEGVVGYPEESATEIGRMPATQPAFVNIGIPHRPVTNHTNLRLVMLSRFTPDIFEYVNSETYKNKLAEIN